MKNASLRTLALAAILSILLGVALSGCGGAGSPAGTSEQDGLKMASMKDMPAEVQSAPAVVQESYQFADANADILEEIPCYCGCGAMGHHSNYACYVQSVGEDGTIEYDGHALGCSICVDITQDTMRMLREGKTTAEIKATVDQTYSKFGPSNIP